MSTSLLYHAFGLRGYGYVKTEYRAECIVFHIQHAPEDFDCRACKSKDVIRRGTTVREFRAVPIGRKHTRFALPVQRIECLRCGTVRQVPLGFAAERFTYTHAFERYALDLLRHMTMKDVARHLDVAWDTIKDIQKRNLQRRFRKPRLKHLECIAIDEISIGRGHRYLTVVLDLKSGAIVFVGDGKGADALLPFWKRLKASHARIKAVAMDMSPAYITAVQTHLPKAKIVFDHFHVIKLYNEKLSDLRRTLYNEAATQLQKDVLKGSRWLLLKNPENLDDKRRRGRPSERERLDKAIGLNRPLAVAYYMRDDLSMFWHQTDKREAGKHLKSWIDRAMESGIKMLQNMAKTLAGHRSGLLAYYDYPITTAALEGTNTKIRVMQRQAYGFRDTEFFKLKIYAVHEAKYALTG